MRQATTPAALSYTFSRAKVDRIGTARGTQRSCSLALISRLSRTATTPTSMTTTTTPSTTTRTTTIVSSLCVSLAPVDRVNP